MRCTCKTEAESLEMERISETRRREEVEDQETPRCDKDRTICRIILCVCTRKIATGRIPTTSASEISESRGVDKDFFKTRNYVSRYVS